jgi:hypothetical protein
MTKIVLISVKSIGYHFFLFAFIDPVYCPVVCFAFRICDRLWSFRMEVILCRFIIVCLYLNCRCRYKYQEKVWIPLIGMTSPHSYDWANPVVGFPSVYVVVVFVSNER